MALVVALVVAPSGWLSVAGTGAPLDETTATVSTTVPATVVYATGFPDAIAAGTVATVYGGTTTAFSRAAGPWLLITVRGSSALKLVAESNLGTVSGTYALLARITRLDVETNPAALGLATGTGGWADSGGGGGGGGSSGAFVWVTKTADYTITGADLTAGHGFLVDASGGPVTITLPTAVGVTAPVTIKRIDTTYANAATIMPHSGETLEGATSALLVRQWHTYEWGSDNANWFIKSGFFANPLLHQGSIAAGDGSAIPTEVLVGTDTYRLTANTAAATGVDYEP